MPKKMKMLTQRKKGSETTPNQRHELFITETTVDQKRYYDLVVVLDGFKFILTPRFAKSNKVLGLYHGTLERIFNDVLPKNVKIEEEK